MSTAICTTTSALRDMLHSQITQMAPDIADLVVTARAPNVARSGNSEPQINLFLFDAPADRTLRNAQRPVAREEYGPSLGVSLHYLLTAYGRDNDDDGELLGQRLLGAAMSVMHSMPILDIAATGPLRVIRLDMTALDLATLWSSFQTPYRLSAAYAVGVLTMGIP